MKNFIETFKIFESKNRVNGLEEFINTLKENFKEYHSVIDDLKSYILKSGCEAIGFDTLYGASGISKTDKCVIADKVLKEPIEKALYVILHEVSHQYQYSKYGKNVMWDSYNSNIDIEKAVDLLMNIELVADRLAIIKTKHLLDSNGVKNYKEVTAVYPKMSRQYFKSHLESLRKSVNDKKIEDVDGVNNMMHNKLKEKPKPIVFKNHNRPKPKQFKNQIEIDRILDKLSDTGWSSLTDSEKSTLRSASNKPSSKPPSSNQLNLF
tara:strand:- start:20584 stop:21378 length:795 start_codon:yes stop_codon:yes gene_type:complete